MYEVVSYLRHMHTTRAWPILRSNKVFPINSMGKKAVLNAPPLLLINVLQIHRLNHILCQTHFTSLQNGWGQHFQCFDMPLQSLEQNKHTRLQTDMPHSLETSNLITFHKSKVFHRILKPVALHKEISNNDK